MIYMEGTFGMETQLWMTTVAMSVTVTRMFFTAALTKSVRILFH